MNNDKTLTEARDKAWKAYRITFWRPPTPRELREVYEAAFTAGWRSRSEDEVDEKAKLFNALQAIYDQERNIELSSFWDGGWTVRYGDRTNGFSPPERFDSLADVANDLEKELKRIYPCADCGTLRSKAEGGTVFTVCDECWDKKHAEGAK